MKIQLKNKDFKKLLRFFDENPSWLGEYSSKDSNGEYITYGQVCEIAWACIREKEMGVN